MLGQGYFAPSYFGRRYFSPAALEPAPSLPSGGSWSQPARRRPEYRVPLPPKREDIKVAYGSAEHVGETAASASGMATRSSKSASTAQAYASAPLFAIKTGSAINRLSLAAKGIGIGIIERPEPMFGLSDGELIALTLLALE